jgi:hypothetical protein
MKAPFYDKIVKIISIKWYNKILLRRAVKEAKINWIKTGKQHYVVCVENKFMIMNNQIFDRLKKPNGKRYTAIERHAIATYVTPKSTFHNI